MELSELAERLVPFAREKYADPDATVSDVHAMPGHAGFAYGFSVTSGARTESWFLRLPPPGVKWQGTADVLRQVQVLGALEGTSVPHCTVKWSGDDLEWFGRPYFIVPRLEGDVLRLGPGEWGTKLPAETLREMARQAMTALAEVHRLDWERAAPGLGPPIPFDDDVTRWDRFLPKLADPERFALQPKVREALLASVPADARVGIFHGDFQVANLFYSFEGRLLAVIDWELVGVGATLNDVGWVATFNDRAAWAEGSRLVPDGSGFPDAEGLIDLYVEAWGAPIPDISWFRALAAYKFAIITGFNLGLHRRGKRPDPLWEDTVRSVEPLLARAAELLGA